MNKLVQQMIAAGSGFNPKSLSPILMLDLLTVNNGYYLDLSANNNQVAATMDGDNYTDRYNMLTMPANHTIIINALKAVNMYGYFYTDDATPIEIRVGLLFPRYSNYVIVGKRYFYLFNGLSANDTAKVLKYEQFLDYDYLQPDINLLDRVNYYPIFRYNVYQGSLTPTLVYNTLASTAVFEDNNLSFSKTKKTLRIPLTNAPTSGTLIGNYTYIFRGDVSFGFWFKKTGIDDTAVNVRVTIDCYGGTLGRFPVRISNLTLGYTYTLANIGTVIVDEVSGDYVHITVIRLAPVYKLQGTINAVIDYYGGATGHNYDIEITDIVLVNNYNGINLNTTYKGIARRTSKFFGKKLTLFGDSITLGGWGDLIQYLLGIGTNYNVATGGTRMGNIGASTWMGTYIDKAVQNPTDIIIINAGANDGGSIIGTIDDTVTTTYYGGYKYCIEYLQAHTTAKILLITPPFIANGTTVAAGRAAYEQQFINLSIAVKALASRYNVDVCDLHSLTSLNWDNVQHYLSDKTHYSYLMMADASNIVAKHMINSNLY